MASHKHLLLFFYITFLYSATTEAQPTYLYNDCSTSNFTGNSAFQWSRTTLLSSLASDNTANTEFYNTTVANDGQTVYGLFMCRGDVSIQVCHQCVVDAAWKLVANCSLSKKAIIWSDECLLRYSGRSFFSTVAITPGVYLWNTANVSSNLQASFMRLLFSTINETADEAAKPALGEKKFATKEANISEFQTLYCLAQCTPDLSPADCRRCLSGVIGDLPWCCEGKQGGRVLYPSCNIRYELYPFYYMETPPPTPTPTTIVPSQGIIPPANPAGSQGKRRDQSPRTIVVVVVSTVVAGILFCFAYCFVRNKMRKSYEATLRKNYFGSESTTLESLQFSLATIEAATNKFSHENSIGKGGFGEVYKGVLSNGQEIAVKRLSKSSGQGAVEFKNEVLLIAKLQHRNLVALLGFCLEEQEKMLVYEYVPNRSLDYFLFGSQKSRALSWLERCKIIGGIARGILYLHEYSRLKIIHRDLKPNNILLDDEMNPKISDFGMARMVAINEVEGSTNRIVGTYGYMSPEYAMFGQYSEKSDVFSFGVMVLEIVSGKKNTSHHESQYIDGLLSYAWKQWRDENLLEILDSNVKEFRSYNEVIKCIQIGLLCVQENPDARPSMATVVSYLSNDLIQLPSPQEPAFFMHGQLEPTIREKESGSDQSTNNSKSCSINEISVSEFFPR